MRWVAKNRWGAAAEGVHSILGYAARGALGVALAVALGVGGVVAGRGLYIFSGSIAWSPWFWLMVCGAGVGAGLGSYMAWLVGGTPRPATVSSIMLLAIASLGVVGGWVGYHWGETQEVACCARPPNSAVAFTVFGAVVGANSVAALLGIFSQLRWRLPSPQVYPEAMHRDLRLR